MSPFPGSREPRPIPSLTRAEWCWLAWFAAALALLAVLPALLAFAREGDAWRFSGFLFNLEDGNSYIAKMVSGAQGDWLFRSRYTTMPQAGALVYSFYTWLGKLAAGPALHTQLLALFHLARLAGAAAAGLGTYLFLARFLESIPLRRLGTALACLGGGLGWLVPLLMHTGDWQRDLPLEFYSPETFGFLSLLFAPHLAFARGLLLFALACYLAPALNAVPFFSRRSPTLWGSLALLALGFLQPLYLLPAGAAVAAHLALLWLTGGLLPACRAELAARFRRAAWMLGIASPWLVYTFLAFQLDPYLRAWAAHERLVSPPLPYYLLAYGLLLPFAALAAHAIIRRKDSPGLLLIGWVLVTVLLVYIPFPAQRRLAEGSWPAWVALALLFFQDRGGLRGLLPRLTLGLSFVVPALFYAASLQAALNPAPPLFLPRAQAEAFQALAQQVQPGDVVLAAYPTGNPLPAWTGARVLAGIGTESANLVTLLPQIEAFYATMSDEQRQSLIREYSLDYVFFGPDEQALGVWDPETAPYLQKVSDRAGYRIYAVRPQTD